MSTEPGDEHTRFTKWAIANGIKIEGVAPARFPGRRLGMIATRDIEENTTLLTIPTNLMVNIDSIPASFKSQFPPGTSIHGILAAYLTHGDPNLLKALDPWRAVWPPWSEFENSMPVFWPQRVLTTTSQKRDKMSTLPPSISGVWNTLPHLNDSLHENGEHDEVSETKAGASGASGAQYQNLLPAQNKRFRDSLRNVQTVYPQTKFEEFAYHWAIINSRSFYYLSPGGDEPEDWNDAIGLVPYADYFNHVDDAACHVAFDENEYTFTATRRYANGEEVYMSYGSHSNDFLLVEYGFCLDSNPSDSVFLDPIILSELNEAQKQDLAANGCLGNYEVKCAGANTSTLYAASITYMIRRDWKKYVVGSSVKGYDAEKTAGIVQGWFEKYLTESDATYEAIMKNYDSAVAGGDREKIDLLLSRWKQIQELIRCALSATHT
ncbi:hypothetical protein BJY04DRAFT_194677 [Aspergillus karnatakaensis]|uniref:uncharacterized protein n=1 Tax=Aspergillus karnatakaensis TaxID=1810916 RepID=UPI003CCCD52F